MTNLIKMDFRIYKYNFMLIIGYSCFFPVLFENASFAGTVSLLCVYMGVMSAMASEETDKIHLLHKALPVTAKEIVGVKYVETAIVWLISAVLAHASAIISNFFKESAGLNSNYLIPDTYSLMFSCILIFSLSMIMVSAAIPMIYKFGYARGRIIITLVWIAASFGLPTYVSLLNFNYTPSYAIACAAALIIAAIATVISFNISVKIYRKR